MWPSWFWPPPSPKIVPARLFFRVEIFMSMFQDPPLQHRATAGRTYDDTGRTSVRGSGRVDSPSLALSGRIRHEAVGPVRASARRCSAGLAGLHHARARVRTTGRGQEERHQKGLSYTPNPLRLRSAGSNLVDIVRCTNFTYLLKSKVKVKLGYIVVRSKA